VAGAAIALLACTGIVPKGYPAQAAKHAEGPKQVISMPVLATHRSAPCRSTLGIASSRIIARIHVRGSSGCPGTISPYTVLGR
jgi:hypothetical protein